MGRRNSASRSAALIAARRARARRNAVLGGALCVATLAVGGLLLIDTTEPPAEEVGHVAEAAPAQQTTSPAELGSPAQMSPDEPGDGPEAAAPNPSAEIAALREQVEKQRAELDELQALEEERRRFASESLAESQDAMAELERRRAAEAQAARELLSSVRWDQAKCARVALQIGIDREVASVIRLAHMAGGRILLSDRVKDDGVQAALNEAHDLAWEAGKMASAYRDQEGARTYMATAFDRWSQAREALGLSAVTYGGSVSSYEALQDLRRSEHKFWERSTYRWGDTEKRALAGLLREHGDGLPPEFNRRLQDALRHLQSLRPPAELRDLRLTREVARIYYVLNLARASYLGLPPLPHAHGSDGSEIAQRTPAGGRSEESLSATRDR